MDGTKGHIIHAFGIFVVIGTYLGILLYMLWLYLAASNLLNNYVAFCVSVFTLDN